MTTRSVKSVCPYCGVGCGIVMQVDGGRVIKVSGDKTHPTNFGRLCTKGSTCAQAMTNSGRMEHAYLRAERGREPARVPIDIAIAETARRLRAVLDRDGPDAIAFYVSGQMSMEAQYLANKLAKGFVRTRHIESNSRLCMASAGSGYKLSLGADGPPGSYQDMDRTDLFFVIGANMADCHPILYLRMMDRVKAGAKLIVVDPRRTTTADKASLYLQIAPGTDLALMNGLLHLLLKNGHTDPAFIAAFTDGWEAMPAFLEAYPPEVVAGITGLPEAAIRQAAQWIGEAPEWMSCWTMGLNQSSHGTWNTNALCNLHLATGAICRPGSGPFSLTGQPNAMGGREMGYMGPGLPGQRSAQIETDRHFVESMWSLPQGSLRSEAGAGTVAMFDEMRASRIKACWVICTNPVASTPNRGRVIEALQAAELVITQDAFLDTETNRYADILLPGALWAEAEGVMVNSERNLTLMQQAVPPPGEALPDWQIIARVACEMGFAAGFSYASAAEVFEEIKQASNPKTGYDLRGASHARLREQPLQWPCAAGSSGDRNPIRYLVDDAGQPAGPDMGPGAGAVSGAGAGPADRGPARPRIVFPTERGRAVFLPRPHLPPGEMPALDFPFVLNTGRLQHQWHTLTKTGKIATLNKLNPGPFIEIHPEDAEALGVRDKDAVEVRSRRGRAVLPAVVTDRVRQGNCFAPFHWNDVFGEDLAINAVTSDAVDPISLQPEFKFCAVALTRVAAAARPATSTQTPTLALAAAPARAAEALVTAPLAGTAPARSLPAVSKELDTMQIDALAQLLGIDAAADLALQPDERLYLQGFLRGLGSDDGRRAPGVPTLPLSAPLAPSTRLVLDGMLAGIFSRSAVGAAALPPPSAAAAPEAPPVLLVWASQTGNAEGFAAECAAQWAREWAGAAATSAAASDAASGAASRTTGGRQVRLLGADALSVAELARAGTALFVVSTFGDGDPPDQATDLWAALQADGAPSMTGTEFAVLAFGDPSYDQFCGFGRKLDARLEALGGRRLLPRVDCDPDSREPATQWRAAVGALIFEAGGAEAGAAGAGGTAAGASASDTGARARSAAVPAGGAPAPDTATRARLDAQPAGGASASASATSPAASAAPEPPRYSRQQPLLSRVLLNRRLSAEGSEKEVRQYAFDIAGSGLDYTAGDALGVWPTNCPATVGDILAALQLPAATPVALAVSPGQGPTEMPLSEALLQHCEIARITPELLRHVQERSASERLADLLRDEHRAERERWLWGRHGVDLFRAFPFAAEAQALVSVLKRLQPRLYSISSSPKAHPGEVHATISTLRYHCDEQPRAGVCSGFLADRSAPASVRIFVQKSAHFHPPADPTAPMIMVGPGTGVAPFRAFLQQRQAEGAPGRNWLFFGEQRAATDFYYRDELQAWLADGLLQRLDTAFSRDQAAKIYVQHRMLEHGAQLWAWLQQGAHFYVCGDAARMAKDVDAALHEVVQVHGALDAERAQAYVAAMRADKRYVRDVY